MKDGIEVAKAVFALPPQYRDPLIRFLCLLQNESFVEAYRAAGMDSIDDLPGFMDKWERGNAE